MKTVAILGITGSIGSTALRGISSDCSSLKIVAASAHSNIDKALDICRKFNIPNLCITSDKKCILCNDINIYYDLNQMLSEVRPQMVLNGIGGSAGLSASVISIENGCKLALANKETVVLGGKAFFDYVKKLDSVVIPVDSEHSALDELINVHGKENVSKLVITASGGPFLNTPLSDLIDVKPQTAAKHPTWNMGAKISIDSSTLANKGLEVIEAHFLFGFNADDIEVVIHPQSIIHSMVRTTGGQVYAQMSPPDMVFPIMRALLERDFTSPVGIPLNFDNLDLSFRKLDTQRFPFVSDAFECVRKEGIYPIIYNIADEVAVDAFMNGRIGFLQIHDVVRNALDQDWSYSVSDVHDIVEITSEIKQRIRF